MDEIKHLWTLSERGDESLGLSCTEEGLFLGRTPLLERLNDALTPRRQDDLERILSHGYGTNVALERVMPGLKTVSTAINDNDLCRARIAAVHLRIPELPDALARLAMEVEDLLVKVEGRSNHYGSGGDWNPDEHPHRHRAKPGLVRAEGERRSERGTSARHR